MRGIAAALVLIALGWGGVADAQTVQCKAGQELLEAKLTDAAKARFNKALDEGEAGRVCGIEGLAAVHKAETANADAKKKQTLGEAGDDVVDFVTGNWVWIVLVLVVWVLWIIGYVVVILVGKDEKVRVRAPASSADLAKGVVAAAHIAGGKHASPAKIYNASDETASTAAADLGKLFRLPGTVPVGELLKRPPFSGVLTQRLRVTGSIAGGWAVIDLTYRQRLRKKRQERIALDLGDVEDDDKAEVLALIGGFWLHAVLQQKTPAPVRDRDAAGVKAHALFRAGAARHARGQTQIARACYTAMPAVGHDEAPFAWAGSRLNKMMALKTERRWLEAMAVAEEVGDFPTGTFDEDAKERFGVDQIDDLLLRQRYITANVRVDHWYAVKDHPNTFSPHPCVLKRLARDAVHRLTELVGTEPGGGGEHEPVHAAGRMTALAYKIAAGEGGELADIRTQLGVARTGGERVEISGAGYYDAACAVSLLLPDLADSDGARDQHIREGLWLLETAVAATREDRRPRVRELAKSDPMLDHLKQADKAGFAKALGEPPEAAQAEHEPTLVETLASAVATITGG